MKKSQRQVLEDHAPWKPAPYEPNIAAALQAMQRGAASLGQQQQLLEWLIKECCRTYDLSFRPGGADGERDTSFAEGRRSVGLQLVNMLNVKLGALSTTRREQ